MKQGILALFAIIFVIILALTNYGERTVVYDCGMAEWHPDIPKEVKEECRKIRKKAIGTTV